MSFKVGNWESIPFWEDVWVGDSSFDVLVSNVYILVCPHNVGIVSMASSSSALTYWNFNFFRNHNEHEIVQLAHLLVLLDNIFFSSSVNDKRVCSQVFHLNLSLIK